MVIVIPIARTTIRMDSAQKQKIADSIDTTLGFLWGIFFLAFPIVFTTLTTDSFVLPKQILLAGVVVLSLLLLVAKMMLTEKVTLRRTPFDVPVGLLLFALLLSAIFAVDRADSLIAVVPVLLSGIGYFVFTNTIKKENTIVFMLASLLVGGGITAILAIFSFFKVYPLFFSYTHIPYFTTLGSQLEQAFYFAFLLPVGIVIALPMLRGKTNNATVTFGSMSILIAAGLFVTIIQLFTTQKPVLLPFETGFQTAFAAISQDTGRIAQGFLLGSGYGNFTTVFTRFKQATFNANPTLWSVMFNQSSSFVLELLATTGILGFLSYLFLLFRVVNNHSSKRANPAFLALILLAITSFVLPFSFVEIGILFILLSLFAAIQGLRHHKDYYDVEFKFVALKRGIISLQQVELPAHEKKEYNRPTVYAVSAVLLVLCALVGWFGGRFVVSDIIFQKSLVLAAANNGTGTYAQQAQAISIFPYRSVYYRIFSQTNIALAGSLASIQPKNGQPNQQAQSTMYTLIQQGITTSRQATTISPQLVANWQNLSSVYRSLIGLGQNADSFAIQAAQEAVVLDPTNPQEYLALGGIYYQLSQWDNAIRYFQQAAAVKQDYSNAYYNLGHAYEQKGDYQNAMAAYQAVKTLVANDKTNTATINGDIAALQQKMDAQNTPQTGAKVTTPKVTPNPTQTLSQPLNLSGQQPQAGQAATPVAQTTPQAAPSPAPAQ